MKKGNEIKSSELKEGQEYIAYYWFTGEDVRVKYISDNYGGFSILLLDSDLKDDLHEITNFTTFWEIVE